MLLIYLLLILMVIIWCFSFIIVDIAVEFIPPLSIALYRFVIASTVFLIVDIYLKLNKRYKSNTYKNLEENIKYSRNDWILLILASFSGVSLFFFAQYNAISLIGPSLPALIICLFAPIFITIFSLIFFNERLNNIKIIGFIIATIGGFLLITGGDLRTLTPESPNFLGYMFALVTPILWATYATLTKKITKTKSSFKMLKYISYIGTIQLFIFVVINNELQIFIENFLNIILFFCALYLGVGCYIIGYYIWQNSQKEEKSFKVASFLYIEPFLTLFFSFLLQRSEIIVIWNIIGGIIVLIAVIIINFKKL